MGLGRAIGAAIALLVVGGCGGDDGTDAGVGVDVAMTSTTTTTTTVAQPVLLMVEEAATTYLSIVEPYNVALEDLEGAVNGGQPLEVLHEKANATATANGEHIEALRGTLWPSGVQAAVDELVAESELAQASWLQAAQAQSVQGFIDAALAAGEHDGGAAVETIRDLLGLDAYDEDSYAP